MFWLLKIFLYRLENILDFNPLQFRTKDGKWIRQGMGQLGEIFVN